MPICTSAPPRCFCAQTFSVFQREGIKVVMMSQGASKTNISLVVEGARGQEAVRVLHREFFDGPSVCGDVPQGVTVGLPNGNGAHN